MAELQTSLNDDKEDVLFDTTEFLQRVPEDGPNLEGDISIPGLQTGDPSTLDEPVKETVVMFTAQVIVFKIYYLKIPIFMDRIPMRDLRAVGKKFFHVLYPKQSRMLLREWDLWGPLVLCVFMAMMLQGSTEEADNVHDGGPQFAEVFVIYWVGAVAVTLNTKLLGGSISFFQSVCVLGYCVLPLCVALILCKLILLAQTQTTALFSVRCIVVIISFAWSTFASTAFLGDSQPPNRKALAVYPIFLFYFVISWLIVSHSN